LKLKIKKLGPITDSEIELGDVTLFLGPPNTGKSYTLKAIYTKLFPLDKYALEFMKKKLKERLVVYSKRVFSDQASNIFRDFTKTIVKIALVATFLPDRDDARDSFERMFKVLMERTGFKGTIEWRETFLAADIETPLINMALDTSLLKEALREALYDSTAELIPVEDLDSIIFEPVELSRIDISFTKMTIEYEVIRQAPLLFEDILYYMERRVSRYLHERERHVDYAGIPRISIARYSSMVLHARTSVKPEIDGLEFSFTIVFRLRLPIRAPIPKERIPTSIQELEDIERILERVFEEAKTDPDLETRIAGIVNYIEDMIVEVFADSLSKTIIRSNLREAFKSRLGLNNLRFIPFGRSIFILGLESAVREPLRRSGPLRAFIRDSYPSAFASYVYWASEGRSRLIERKLNERQARLVKAFTPLLEGVLSADAFGRLVYRDWRGSVVDFQMTSALVQEVSGLLFALLSIDDNAIVLVEEPEAQLHPGAQIIMALLLASLPSLCGCRVVASTHSDLLAITLSQLAVQKPDKEWVKELLESLLEKLIGKPSEEMLPHLKEGVDVLAEAVAKTAENFNLKIYEFTREGKVKPVEPEKVLSEEVPGMTKVINELIDWAFRLASYRVSKEGGR